MLRRFTLLSLATTLVVGVTFGAITAKQVENFALRRHARLTADHVLDLSQSRLVIDDFRRPPAAKRTHFDRAMAELSGRTGIVQVTVWNPRGDLLYGDGRFSLSQEPSLESQVRRALDGQVRWQVIASPNESGRNAPLLEVFVPLVAAGSPEPLAVYRIRSDLSEMAPALARLIWSVQISVVLGVLMLYAVLFVIVRSASADLERKESALRYAFVGIIRSLVNALDMRDMATAHHSSRVAENAVKIARAMDLDESSVNEIQIAGFLHDIGKIGIRDELLSKDGPLTEKEREIIKRHTVFGYDILDPVSIPERIKLAVRHSHERWDGKGYPDGLKGEQIPVAARIIAVADAFEALTTERSYRPAQSPRKAVAEISRCAGQQFDPAVVAAAMKVWKKQVALRRIGSASRTAAG